MIFKFNYLEKIQYDFFFKKIVWVIRAQLSDKDNLCSTIKEAASK
ncbi:MAG: hypothetical protein JWR54_216 [Mucilaginibacter sp.]|nr:hypothetical protein [Mucilaginibacter sp.]